MKNFIVEFQYIKKTHILMSVDIIPFLNDYVALFRRSGRAKRNPTRRVRQGFHVGFRFALPDLQFIYDNLSIRNGITTIYQAN